MTTRTEDALALTVNGRARVLLRGGTVADLLRAVGHDPDAAQGLAVAVNEAVVRRQAWAAHTLHDGDEVEVITALQGG